MSPTSGPFICFSILWRQTSSSPIFEGIMSKHLPEMDCQVSDLRVLYMLWHYLETDFIITDLQRNYVETSSRDGMSCRRSLGILYDSTSFEDGLHCHRYLKVLCWKIFWRWIVMSPISGSFICCDITDLQVFYVLRHPLEIEFITINLWRYYVETSSEDWLSCHWSLSLLYALTSFRDWLNCHQSLKVLCRSILFFRLNRFFVHLPEILSYKSYWLHGCSDL